MHSHWHPHSLASLLYSLPHASKPPFEPLSRLGLSLWCPTLLAALKHLTTSALRVSKSLLSAHLTFYAMIIHMSFNTTVRDDWSTNLATGRTTSEFGSFSRSVNAHSGTLALAISYQVLYVSVYGVGRGVRGRGGRYSWIATQPEQDATGLGALRLGRLWEQMALQGCRPSLKTNALTAAEISAIQFTLKSDTSPLHYTQTLAKQGGFLKSTNDLFTSLFNAS
jgi:hypothetical protein